MTKKKSQSAAAKILGVSRQAVNQRLQELRGRTTKVIVAKETKRALQQSFNAVEQLNEINEKNHCSFKQSRGRQYLFLEVYFRVEKSDPVSSGLNAFLIVRYTRQQAPPESNLKKLLWGEIGSIAEQHSDLFKPDNLKNLHISRSAQRFISGVTIPSSGTESQREAKFSGKHSPHLLFIIDEGDAVPDEIYRGIESCMSGGHARLLIMFNPRAEVGEAYRMERNGHANIVHLSAFNHPNVISGVDQIPGAVTRETTIRRINEWCRPLAEGESIDGECFELPSFLEGKTAKSQNGKEYPSLHAGYYKIMEPAFSYMVLDRYPLQSFSF